MHLSKYLEARGAKARFAESTALSATYITDLCRDSRWPSREVWEKIVAATGGQVTPNDHLTGRTGATDA